MTVAELKADFSRVLNKVQGGTDVQILYGRKKTPVAVVTRAKKEGRRAIGTFDGKAKFTEKGDGKMNVEEFLG